MKIRLNFYLASRETPQGIRWWMLWKNSRVSCEHNEGMPNYIRYEGKKWRLRVTWGSRRKLKEPTLLYEAHPWPVKRRVYDAKLRA